MHRFRSLFVYFSINFWAISIYTVCCQFSNIFWPFLNNFRPVFRPQRQFCFVQLIRNSMQDVTKVNAMKALAVVVIIRIFDGQHLHSPMELCFKIWADPGLFFVYFRPFLIPITNIVWMSTKYSWRTWDLNPGLQDCKCRQDHRGRHRKIFKTVA